jgi:uncharacterized protein
MTQKLWNISQTEALIQSWLSEVVVGLNLCPFARKPFEDDRIRIATELSGDYEALLARFLSEVDLLMRDEKCLIETSLLVLPNTLHDFNDYLDCLSNLNEIVSHKGLEGEIQVASFHPGYQFHGTEPDDVSNYTNRAPFPVFHLIREASLEKALESHPDPDAIPGRNIDLMESMEESRIKALFPWLYSKA